MTLSVQDLTVRFGSGRDELTAVDRVSLEIAAGETLGLVGESGSGKTTLARALVGLVPSAEGAVHLGGVDFSGNKARNSIPFRRRVQLVMQDPGASLNPRMTIGEALVEAVALRGAGKRSDRHADAVRVLDMVGIASSALDRYPHQFSGGQRQRIAIARALAVGAELLVLDEITSALDVSVQAKVLNLLKELQRELDLALLFISHDLAVVGTMSDRVAVMYLGRFVEYAPAGDLFASPRHPYTQALMMSIPDFSSTRKNAPLRGDVPDPRDPPEGCRFHTRCPVGPLANPQRTICVERDPQSDAAERIHCSACHFAGDGVDPARRVAVSASSD